MKMQIILDFATLVTTTIRYNFLQYITFSTYFYFPQHKIYKLPISNKINQK